jgi:hypothetical protein
VKRFALLSIGFAGLFTGQAFAGLLQPGQGLAAGERIYSNNGQYFAQMQSDGNFVVYTNGGKALWSTNTTGLGANWAVMQSDGNFALYNKEQGRAVWSSNTAYNMSGYASITDYGQWIVFKVIPVWSSNTSDRSNPVGANAVIFGEGTYLEQGKTYAAGQYSLTFQYDGNLVIYNPQGAMWSTGTTNKGATWAGVSSGMLSVGKTGQGVVTSNPPFFQSPVNVPLSQFSVTEWNSEYLAMQADGNLVMYVPQRVFASHSPYAPATVPISNGPGCYGPPDACFGSTLPIFNYSW